MIQQTFAGGIDVEQWDIIAERVRHPADGDGPGFGALLRNRHTGIFAYMLGGGFRTVPQAWAARVAAQQQAQ